MSANGISTLASKDDRRTAKLALAQAQREILGSADYRPYNIYIPPGTVSPAEGHPWSLDATYEILLENGDYLLLETGQELLMEF